MSQHFQQLWLSSKTLLALEKKWFIQPSPIQEKVIPLLLQEWINVIWQASTWTGKTAAFALPLIEKLKPQKKVQALVLVPTRELANQVAEEINSLQSNSELKILPIYGGQSYSFQLSSLKRGVDIIVWTPWRIIDHLDRKVLDLSEISYFILDEADEMLNMGFVEDIEKIFKHTNKDKSVLLFSATMPKAILSVAKKYMWSYQLISTQKEQATTTQTSQIYFEVHEQDKVEALCRIIDIEPDFYGIVFCKTRLDVDDLVLKLTGRWYHAQWLHGDIVQKQRENVLRSFKKKSIKILVATDVAARGIDVDNVSHVINYSLPQDTESYIHRVWRTGRAWKTGIAVTFVTPKEYRRLISIKKITNTDIQKAKIPTATEIVSKKKEQLFADIQAILDGGNFADNFSLADQLVEHFGVQNLVSAFLKLHYDTDFDVQKYPDLNDVKIDSKGKTRLFVALWRKAGYSARSLVDMLCAEAKIKPNTIDDVRVMDDFSFLTVPYIEAEHILHIFKKKAQKWKSLISKAKDKDSNKRWFWRRKRY